MTDDDTDLNAFVRWCLTQDDILLRWLNYKDVCSAHERHMAVWTAFREAVPQS